MASVRQGRRGTGPVHHETMDLSRMRRLSADSIDYNGERRSGPGLDQPGRLALFFAHGVLRGEPAGSADIDLEEVEKPGLDTGGFGDGGGVAVVGRDQAQVGQRAEDGLAGGAGGGGSVAGQAGHHLAM